jgi:uncharacterized integral membrane protein
MLEIPSVRITKCARCCEEPLASGATALGSVVTSRRERQLPAVDVSDGKLEYAMRNVYAILLSLFGLILAIFNRFAVEESYKAIPPWAWGWKLPIWLARVVVVLTGTFCFLFGLLTVLGYLQ